MNILFLFADDWGKHASSYAKLDKVGGINDAVNTPNIDRIAAEGVLFRHAFVNAPSCTPCRSSLLSGQHFWRTRRGAILQGAVWDDNIPSWPLMLRDRGYLLGKSWKVWSPGTPVDAPYGKQQYAYQDVGNRINKFSQNVMKLVASGKSVAEAKLELLDEVRANFKSLLANQKEDQPFSYWFGPTNVHRSWAKESGAALWGLKPDDLKGKMPPYLPDVPEIREDLVDYLGEVQAFDASVGVLLDELKKSGKYDNTLIVVSGDHGPPGFPHGKCNLYDFGTQVALAIAGPGVQGGRVVDDFVSLPDLAPTFLEAGGVEASDSMNARSLWPVLHSDREGLIDPSRDAVYFGRERHVAAARSEYLPYPQRAIRTADHLFIINFHPDRYPLGDPFLLDGNNPPTAKEVERNTFATLPDEDAGPTKAWIVSHRNDQKWKPYYDHAYGKRPREELFDLKKDPHQMHNIATVQAYASVVRKLRQRLMNELKQTGDPRLIDHGKFFETPPMAGPIPKNTHQTESSKVGFAEKLHFKHHFGDREIQEDALGQTALVDLDRDGDLDFITGKRRGTVWWYEYLSADHWKRHTLGENSSSDVGGAALDVNRDGWIDFVTGGAWYENPQNPRVATFRRHVFDKKLVAVHDVVVGDLNGDRRPDVVTMSDQNDLRWYQISDDPTGRWKMTAIGQSVHAGICLGDLDGDGDLDVVRSNVWMENQESGTQWTGHKMTEPWGASEPPFAVNATRTCTADINTDGRLDVVIADGENRGARIAWLEAPVDPRLGKWQIHYLPKADLARRGAYHSLQVGDLDNDGDVDIFTVEMEAFAGDRSPRWFIWENLDGRGRLVERVILDAKLGGHEAVIGDVDGDGDLDICSKLWRPMRVNGNGGKNHFDYLENQSRMVSEHDQ